jgi:hypothetical protein
MRQCVGRRRRKYCRSHCPASSICRCDTETRPRMVDRELALGRWAFRLGGNDCNTSMQAPHPTVMARRRVRRCGGRVDDAVCGGMECGHGADRRPHGAYQCQFMDLLGTIFSKQESQRVALQHRASYLLPTWVSVGEGAGRIGEVCSDDKDEALCRLFNSHAPFPLSSSRLRRWTHPLLYPLLGVNRLFVPRTFLPRLAARGDHTCALYPKAANTPSRSNEGDQCDRRRYGCGPGGDGL